MKPWYWPVTSTVYKLSVGFILVGGVYHLLELFSPLSGLALGGVSGMLAYIIYISLWKRDWL